MNGLLAQSSLLFAQNTETVGQPAPQGGAQNAPQAPGPFDMMIFLLPLLLIMFWFFVMRPQQKQDENQRKLLSGLQKNDRVYTVSGLIGTVYSIDEDKKEIVLKIDDSNGTKARFLVAAIAGVIPKDGDKEKSNS